MVLASTACGGGDGDDGSGTEDAAPGDGSGSGDAATLDGPSGDESTVDAAAGRRILFQCDAFNGGLCTMDDDGDNRQTLNASGRGGAPRETCRTSATARWRARIPTAASSSSAPA